LRFLEDAPGSVARSCSELMKVLGCWKHFLQKMRRRRKDHVRARRREKVLFNENFCWMNVFGAIYFHNKKWWLESN